MNASQLIHQMQLNANRIRALVDGISQEQARWNPAPDSWSILEVVNHLYDEECLDFRVRLDIILHRPQEQWPPIDPQGWVKERQYNQRDLANSLENYLSERKKSLAWLKNLGEVDWDTNIPAPWGMISAGDMFVAWAAHDLLHMRQLVELQHAYAMRLSDPYNSTYAGEW